MDEHFKNNLGLVYSYENDDSEENLNDDDLK